jgi:excisionase family DNA binding protein
MVRRSFFTTFDISQICEVNPSTVQNWIRNHKLKAYVTPGGHRRVSRADLLAFLHEFGMPIPAELAESPPLILIVDDEEDIRDLLSQVMQSEDGKFEVVTATGGVEALLFIGERKPELLILDIMMAGMNGLEVCRKVKGNAATRQIKIVAITGKQDPAIRLSVLEAGADLFFTKPLQIVEFRDQALKLMRS